VERVPVDSARSAASRDVATWPNYGLHWRHRSPGFTDHPLPSRWPGDPFPRAVNCCIPWRSVAVVFAGDLPLVLRYRRK
jgi:hypothetical protein